jgi:hypothetical protein
MLKGAIRPPLQILFFCIEASEQKTIPSLVLTSEQVEAVVAPCVDGTLGACVDGTFGACVVTGAEVVFVVATDANTCTSQRDNIFLVPGIRTITPVARLPLQST